MNPARTPAEIISQLCRPFGIDCRESEARYALQTATGALLAPNVPLSAAGVGPNERLELVAIIVVRPPTPSGTSTPADITLDLADLQALAESSSTPAPVRRSGLRSRRWSPHQWRVFLVALIALAVTAIWLWRSHQFPFH